MRFLKHGSNYVSIANAVNTKNKISYLYSLCQNYISIVLNVH